MMTAVFRCWLNGRAELFDAATSLRRTYPARGQQELARLGLTARRVHKQRMLGQNQRQFHFILRGVAQLRVLIQMPEQRIACNPARAPPTLAQFSRFGMGFRFFPQLAR